MSDSFPSTVLGLQFFYAGSEDCRPLHRWQGVRDHWLFHLIHQGRGQVRLRDEQKNLEKGQGFLVPPHTEVDYQADRESPWSYSWIACSGPEAAAAFQAAGLSPAQPWYTRTEPGFAEGQEFRRLVDRLNRESDRFLQTSELVAAFAWLRRGLEAPQEGYAALVDDFIRRNFSRQNARIETWARQVGLSRKHLSEVVKEHRGASPRALLTEYRLVRASELLLTTDLSVGAVAASVGYGDPLAFSRAFRQRFGTSPRGWRRSK